MPPAEFNPHTEPRPCWHCVHFGASIHGGTAAWCERPGCAPVHASPARGCAFFVREIGADDEPGPPLTAV